MGERRRSWHCYWVIGILICTTGCSLSRSTEPPRSIKIQQAWQLQPGDKIADRQVVAGLGDISIALNGSTAYTPFDGKVQPNTEDCVLFSSLDVPAYLFRLCGLDQPRLGELKRGTAIGSGRYLHFATLRKQPDGTWAMVEPSRETLERILQSP